MDSRIKEMIADLCQQLQQAIANGDTSEQSRIEELLDRIVQENAGA